MEYTGLSKVNLNVPLADSDRQSKKYVTIPSRRRHYYLQSSDMVFHILFLRNQELKGVI